MSDRCPSVLTDPGAAKLYRYWRGLCRYSRPPSRFDIDPYQLTDVLPNVFIVEHEGENYYRYRIAGSSMCSLFGKPLRRRSFLEPWNHLEREALETLLANIMIGTYVGTTSGSAWGGGDRLIQYKMLLLPTRYGDGPVSRILGFFSMPKSAQWIGRWPLLRLTIANISLSRWEEIVPPPTDFFNNDQGENGSTGHGGGHLRVIDGGRV